MLFVKVSLIVPLVPELFKGVMSITAFLTHEYVAPLVEEFAE